MSTKPSAHAIRSSSGPVNLALPSYTVTEPSSRRPRRPSSRSASRRANTRSRIARQRTPSSSAPTSYVPASPTVRATCAA
ncbi:hypothetical protein [Streptomyces sp. NPDC056401]|uniref:hypothetical protein n=1 Tax=Streptomyces sp. NPDC056401 TaxID=3345809 RepID=UPI0035DC1015